MNNNGSTKFSDSATVMMNSLVQQKAHAGIKIYNFGVGEPKLLPHPIVVQATLKALDAGKTLYPPVSGVPELREVATCWMNDLYSCHFQPENCLVVNGGKFGIYLLLQHLLHPGDEVIIPAPYWVSYPAITQLFGGVPKIVSTQKEEMWKLTPQDLKKAYSAKSKILILNNASNPTGALYQEEELKALLEIAYEHQLLIISDEVYSGLSYEDPYISCGAFQEFKEQVIIIQSCSKNFAMTGWRIGFVFAPSSLIKPCTSLLSQSTSGVTTLSQWVSVEILKEARVVNHWVRTKMLQRRELFIKVLHDFLGIEINIPSSLYAFISLSELGIDHLSSTEFCALVLEKANVALVPGECFGKEGFIRFSFGIEENDIIAGMKIFADLIKNELACKNRL